MNTLTSSMNSAKTITLNEPHTFDLNAVRVTRAQRRKAQRLEMKLKNYK